MVWTRVVTGGSFLAWTGLSVQYRGWQWSPDPSALIGLVYGSQVAAIGLQEVKAVRQSHMWVLVNGLSHQEGQLVGVLAGSRDSDGSLWKKQIGCHDEKQIEYVSTTVFFGA